MLDLNTILDSLSEEDFSYIQIELNEEYDLNAKNSCFILKEGDVLSYGEKNFTHLLRVGDPIRIAESIYARENILSYKRKTDISLIKFDGKKMREEVNRSSALVKSIIKYSMNRICGLGNSKVPYYFEDEFLYKFNNELKRLNIEANQILFSCGDTARKMYFVESGSIILSQESGNKIAVIEKGECFGESALLQGIKRTLRAEATENSKLRTIDIKIIEAEILKETGLAQIAVFGVLRRLDFMNILRNPNFQNSEII